MLPLIRELLSALPDAELDAAAELIADLRASRTLALPKAVPAATSEDPQQGRTHFQREYVRCGKARCRCMRDDKPHGPYWYAYEHRYAGERYSYWSRDKMVTKVARATRVARRYYGPIRPSALSDQDGREGAGSADRAVVAQTERVEAALWQEITAKNFAQARMIAGYLSNASEWMQLVDREERIAERAAKRRRRTEIIPVAVESEPDPPLVHWMIEHVPGKVVRTRLVDLWSELPTDGRLGRQQRAHVITLLRESMTLRAELLPVTAALTAILHAHAHNAAPSDESIRQIVTSAYAQAEDDVRQRELLERVAELEQRGGAVRGEALVRLRELADVIARDLDRLQLNWGLVRLCLHRKAVDPCRWMEVEPLPISAAPQVSA